MLEMLLYSLATSLGTPVPLLINASLSSANHMAAHGIYATEHKMTLLLLSDTSLTTVKQGQSTQIHLLKALITAVY